MCCPHQFIPVTQVRNCVIADPGEQGISAISQIRSYTLCIATTLCCSLLPPNQVQVGQLVKAKLITGPQLLGSMKMYILALQPLEF